MLVVLVDMVGWEEGRRGGGSRLGGELWGAVGGGEKGLVGLEGGWIGNWYLL